MRLKHRKPCAECPFLKNSQKGYLGPETVESIEHAVHSEAGFACHMDLPNQPDHPGGGKDVTNAAVCVGGLISASMSCKVYRTGNPLAKLQRMAPKSNARVMDAWEFQKYHGKENQ